MRTQIKLFLFAIFTAAFIPTFASAGTVAFNPETDCALLKNHTALLVHTTCCGYCQKFKPVYTELSNNKKYKKWTFYDFDATDAPAAKSETALVVCGHTIRGFPTVFVNNQELQDRNKLQTYLDNNK